MRFSKILAVLILTAVLTGAGPVAAEEQARQDRERFQLGVTGSLLGAQEWTHSTMLRYAKAQDLFMALAQNPRREEFVKNALEGLPFGLEEIMVLELLRREDGLYYINFNFFTQADQKAIYQASEKFAGSLTRAYLDRKKEIWDILDQKTQDHISHPYLAYILLGCFSLDWDGLDLTREMGLRIAGTHTSPEGGIYTPWAKERGDVISLQYLFWGSHNQKAHQQSYTFTSFGDHYSRRITLPDLFWYSLGSVGNQRLPEKIEDLNASAARPFLKDMLVDIGRLLKAIREEPKTLAELAETLNLSEPETGAVVDYLEDLQFVSQTREGYLSAIPVLGPKDKAMVEDLMALSQRIMRGWLEENYHRVNSELGDITPLRHGVPLEIVFTQIWHFVFGLTNRDLVRAGMFRDPYGEDRRYPGSLPALWDEAIYEGYRPY